MLRRKNKKDRKKKATYDAIVLRMEARKFLRRRPRAAQSTSTK